jgi:glycosyltransferase involved in cell wall biosynthesis
VTVYGRRGWVPDGLVEHAGCRIVSVPTIRTKSLETLAASLLQSLHAFAGRYDAVLMVNAANAPFLFLFRLAGFRTALNVDGIERMREKWGLLGRLWYRFGELLAARLPDVVVADARVIADYYGARHGIRPVMIPYGGDLPAPAGHETLDHYGLVPHGYILYVSRFEPENNPHRVVDEYRRLRERVLEPPPLVMVGDAPYQKRWIASWKRNAPPGVIFPGAIYGEGYRQLLARSLLYVQATEVGGTHPALVEAMGYGCRILYNATPENCEVAEGCGLPFSIREPDSLARLLAGALNDPTGGRVYREAARSRVLEHYTWDGVVAAYRRILEGNAC